ncbi:flavin reductase family protein [Pseudomonas citronellolis]|uniref:flavin reductase family protein n=1 Tax=Pseudomonas citronellolis TaxID=53408 RepID=UPI0021C1DE9C|nr:flavin reductase family protein [Pseudomonas citronellolis]UXJ50037.1 flavin reductase family protein [Pseudomonas citronellolis]
MIERSQLRQALGQFATGVTIVTTLDGESWPIGVTANSFNAVSLEPPLVLWSIGKSAYSYPAFAGSEHFAVHVLGEGQRALSDRFAQASTDKFAGLEVGAGVGGVPLLPGCLTVFECATEHRYDGGDHLILVGRVLRMAAPEPDMRPLLFHRGRYQDLAHAQSA